MSTLGLLGIGCVYHLDKRKRGEWFQTLSSNVYYGKLSSWKTLLCHVTFALPVQHDTGLWASSLTGELQRFLFQLRALPGPVTPWILGKRCLETYCQAQTLTQHWWSQSLGPLFCVPQMVYRFHHYFLPWPWQTLGGSGWILTLSAVLV